jgi:uncharacterized repeat protein (TIGR02543 family)
MKKIISAVLTIAICLSFFTFSAQAANAISMDFDIRWDDDRWSSSANVNISWDIDYFKQSATIYNHDLAIAAIVLANAAYAESNVTLALEKLSFTNVSSKYDYKWNQFDRVAYSFAYNKNSNVVAIVLRGTPPLSSGDLTEWYSNLVNNLTDAEFVAAMQRVKSDEKDASLNDYLKKYGISNPKFFIVGHSRGAAVADLLGASLVSEGYSKDSVFVYSFGTPNHTKSSFRAEYTNIFNILNKGDGVPYQPKKTGKYGIITNKTIMKEAVYEEFNRLTGRDLKEVMNKSSLFSVDNKLYVLSDSKQRYAHHTVTYLAVLLSEKTGANPSGGGSGGGGEEITISAINKNMTIDVGAGSTLRVCASASWDDRITALSNGTTVYVYGFTTQAYENRIWAKIRYNNQDGWLNSQYLVDSSSAATTTQTTPALKVVNPEEGSYTVAIPANYRLDCYQTSTAAARYTYVSPKTLQYNVLCTKRYEMSDGTTRYFFVSGDNKNCYFVFTSAMSVAVSSPQSTTSVEERLPNGIVTILYNANGGNGAPSSHTAQKDQDGIVHFNIALTEPTRSGYTFLGWKLFDNSAYDIVVSGERLGLETKNATSDETLTYYAQWKAGTITVNPTATFSNLSTGWDGSRFYFQFYYKAEGNSVTDAYITTQTDIGYKSSDDEGPWGKSDYLRIYCPSDLFTEGKTYSWAATVVVDGQEIVSSVYSFVFKKP